MILDIIEEGNVVLMSLIENPSLESKILRHETSSMI